jgi:hypothetical protein
MAAAPSAIVLFFRNFHGEIFLEFVSDIKNLHLR